MISLAILDKIGCVALGFHGWNTYPLGPNPLGPCFWATISVNPTTLFDSASAGLGDCITNLIKIRAFASHRSFVVTGTYDYMLPEPEFTLDDSRRGFKIWAPNIIYHFIWNDLWDFVLQVRYMETPPTDFGDAERVIHLPFVTAGLFLLHGDTDWQAESFIKLPLQKEQYSIFSQGWNLGHLSTDEEAELDDEAFCALPHVERYLWTICPLVKDEPAVVVGKEFMY